MTFVRFAEKNSQGDKHKILSEAVAGEPQEIHYLGTSSTSGGPIFNSTHPSFWTTAYCASVLYWVAGFHMLSHRLFFKVYLMKKLFFAQKI